MEYNAPHGSAAFEGFYSKFDLPSGGHLALILCKVKAAKQKPNMVSFTYVPPHGTSTYQKEIWAEQMEMIVLSSNNAFQIDVPGIGYVKWNDDSSTEYSLECDEFVFEANTTSRTAWSDGTQTPESLLVNLPLPLHWHVHSLASDCEFKLEMPIKFPSIDHSGHARVHQEKNWAHSFPSAHMWIQVRDNDRGFCCAGGKILGMEAFLLGYRSKQRNVDFRPPFALRFAGLSPFMSYTSDWENRRFEMSVQGFTQKLTVTAEAPKGTFFSLSSPFPEGHRENFLSESFQTTLKIKIFESNGFSQWRLVHEDAFENASLEFGGEYYPPAGSSERTH